MIRYVLKLEDMGNGKARIYNPGGTIQVPTEVDLGPIDPTDVDFGIYLVLGPKVREWRDPMPSDDAKKALRDLHGSEGKEVGKGMEKYQVFRFE